MGKDLQALRGIAQIVAVTIVAELNNISGKDRSCNRRLRIPIRQRSDSVAIECSYLNYFRVAKLRPGFRIWANS
jgi:hypothetical protein